ncbi:MAG: hypothetical protein IPK26_19595 [Planctomycetes bacterium]|nr:hypothetical protein [Planctomycetota bacterium]
MLSSRPCATVLCAVVWLSALRAQGNYVNFEEPQIKPIAIANVTLAGVPKSFALVCNTPDNSVEIWDGATQTFLSRVPVGLSPVTVRWHDASKKFYTCNFLGDSVTIVRLEDAGGVVAGVVERTVRVGDEPTDIAFAPTGGTAWVTLHSRSRVAIVQASDLAPVAEMILQKADPAAPDLVTALKAPRRIEMLADGRTFVLNTMGGRPGSPYDVDLWVEDPFMPASAPAKVHLVGGLGSTNTAFAIDSTGQRMFVVGGVARIDGVGVQAVASEPLGFVESHLWVVDLPTNGTPPAAVPEQLLGQTTPWQSIDLNQNYTAGADTPVAITKRVSQPTDVLLVESQPGQVSQVVVACFGSDKILVLTPSSSANGGYQRTHIDLVPNQPTLGYSAVGPRGMCRDPATGLIWVANRLDQSLLVFDPTNPANQTRRDLNQDPTSVTIRTGRKFLYSAHLTSGSRMVACASCHVDGRTDGLPWNLGHEGPATPIASRLIDDDSIPATMPTNKGPLVTQSLQGLVNYHIDSAATQYVATNAPYHWRGDKDRFQDFNEAFVNLQGLRSLNSNPSGPDAIGILAADMDAYAAFIHTIHYPPNPEQPRTRSNGNPADLGTPGSLDDGTGALYGMKVFHTMTANANRACAHCHTLPEGSSNTFILLFNSDGGFPNSGTQQHPLESAALRGLFQREKSLVTNFDASRPGKWTRIAEFGLLHSSDFGLADPMRVRSINDFLVHSFDTGDSPSLPTLQRDRFLNQFVRQLDWGVGPMVGWTMTVDTAHPVDTALLADMRAAVEEANAGLAVYVRTGTSIRGYWYDTASTPAVYRRVGGVQQLSEAGLLGLIQSPNDVAIFTATPTGTERRLVHASGNPPVLGGGAPTSVTLLAMVPNTAYVDVTRLDVNHTPTGGATTQSIEAMRAMESAARMAGIPGIASLPRHEPPRRFRVAGNDIRFGAKLRLGMSIGTAGSGNVQWLELDLAPTRYRFGNQVVWETAEELDGKMTMEFVNGGPELTVVRAVSDGNLAQAGQLAPAAMNWFLVDVVNADGTSVAAPTWQPVTIDDQR